ncbi:MAG: hypothetical protein ACFFET_13415 [Candidatus Thorarchaeota archaeon]
MRLTKENFTKASVFVRFNARPVDRALYEYHFENGPISTVLEELAKFQNDDGGFGNAIEPDFRLKASSPMATSVGLQYCTELGLESDHPIIESAIKYLVSTYDFENDYWPATSPDVNDEPHAPWWHVIKIAPPEEKNWPNPSAEILGYVHKHSVHVPKGLLKQVNRRALENLNSSETIGGLYNLMCWDRAYRYLPEPLRSDAEKKLTRTIQAIMPLTSEALGEIRISWLAPSTDSLFLMNPDNLYKLLAEEIHRQAEDGGWWPAWKWGQFEDVWPIAEREWAGKITVHCLTTLRAFNLNDRLIEP